MKPSLQRLIQDFKAGHPRALARLITEVENRENAHEEILEALYSRVGRAHRIGITGPPGAGKSTLVDALALHFQKQGKRVGVIAVDPSSPFTGGALLGDRHRMTRATQAGIFIRSLATRGSLGGLSEATPFVADLMDAFGFDVVLIETVGVGQAELDIIHTSDTVVVVLVPESGDAIQAMKAGLMEIADIFVINKYDREGAHRFQNELESVLSMQPRREGEWTPPVIPAVATREQGVPELAEALERHLVYLKQSGRFLEKRKHRILDEIERTAKDLLWRRLEGRLSEALTQQWLQRALKGEETPYALARRIVEQLSREA